MDYSNDALFLDTETTGLGGDAEIVEIAVLDRSGKPILDTLVRPTCSIPAAVVAIHGITDRMVHSAPTWPEIHAGVAGVLAGRKVIAYNAPFDARMIDQVSRRHGLATPAYTPMCAMQASLLAAGQNKPFESLDAALARWGVAREGRGHRARADCLSTLRLMEALATRTCS